MCKYASLPVLVWVLAVAGPIAADEGLPEQHQEAVEAATVYVKSTGKDGTTTGSGFLVHVKGEIGYIVTNSRVIARRGSDEAREVSVVFRSGTGKEQVRTARLIHNDSLNKMSILQVKGKDLPRPLELANESLLRNTTEVYSFGYPLDGKPVVGLAPAIIDRFVEGDRGKLVQLGLAGDLNLGYQGGPVVNSIGKVVGVAEAMPVDTKKLHAAIPVTRLSELLNGRIAAYTLRQNRTARGTADVELEFTVIDPLNRIKSIAVNYLPRASLKEPIGRNPRGAWLPLPGAQKAECKVEEGVALANLTLMSRDGKPAAYVFQAEIVKEGGKAVAGVPTSQNVTFDGAARKAPSLDLSAPSAAVEYDPTARLLEAAGVVPLYLGLEVSPRGGNLFLTAGDGSVMLYSYPGLEIRATYTLAGGGIPYRAALDAERGLLYLAVSKSRDFRRFPFFFNLSQARGDIVVVDVRELLRSKDPVSGSTLEPLAVIAVDAAVAKLELSADSDALYFLDVKTPTACRLGKIDTRTRKVESVLKLADRTELMCLSADRRFIYTAAAPDGHKLQFFGTYRGIIQQIDPATMKVRRQLTVNADPHSMAATNQGIVFVSGGNGNKSEVAVVNVNADEKSAIVARWKAPRDCEIQITPDEKALVAASTGRDPAFVLVWKIPAQLSNSSPIIRQQIQPAEQMTGGPITVSPDSKAFFCHQGGVFWLPSDGSNRGGNDPAPVRLPAQHVINLGDGLQLKMVRVGKGQFWMGSPANELQRNKLNEGQRPVEIEDDFYLGVHEVTQGQWQAIMGDNPSWFSRTGGGKNKVKDIADDELKQFPVDTVSWSDIQLFLQKLNEREKARNTGWRYRLPMEAEWEYACRGGPASQQDGKKTAPFYLAGPSFSLSSKQANFEGGTPYGEAEKGPHLGRPSKVGSYAPNVLGLYDMHGNVWELCDDWVHQRPEGHPKRAIRGGSYNSEGSYCRTALPISRSPTERYPDMGFRLARVRAEK